MVGKYESKGSGFYQNCNSVVWVRSVDREYRGNNKPKMFMSYKHIGAGSKFQYVSGLFKTKRDDVYSFDKLNEVGIKVFYECIFSAGGIEILKSVSVKKAV